MPKERRGCFVKRGGNLCVRVSYTDGSGKRREIVRKVENRTEGRKLLKKLLDELSQPERVRTKKIQGEKMTFGQLVDAYTKEHIIPPIYHNDRKIAGLRSHQQLLWFLKPLKNHFPANKKIVDITSEDLERYKITRLKTPTNQGNGIRSLACVHRELSLLKGMFSFAKRQKWLAVNPFDEAKKPIISPADEVRRSRVMTLEEEEKILAVCVGKQRKHLRAPFIAAVDTGLRKNELLTLTWNCIDLSNQVIRLKAFNSKTAKARETIITDRLAKELERIRREDERINKRKVAPHDLVFTCGDVRHAWRTALRLAGVDDLRWHDLRHVFASRLSEAGLPLSSIAHLLGHSTIQMTLRYSNATSETLIRAASILNGIHKQE